MDGAWLVELRRRAEEIESKAPRLAGGTEKSFLQRED